MIQSIAEVTRHELLTAFRTRRAIWVAAIYLGSAILGGVALILAMRLIEQQAIEAIMAQGASADQAANTVSLLGEPAFEKLAALFSGVEIEQLAVAYRTSLIVPFFFWSSLTFLPFLILLTSFDQVAADLYLRSICYTALRVSRPALLYGKALAQTVIFVGLTAVALLVWLLLATTLLESFDFTDALPGVVRMIVLLVPFGLCYLAISAFCSTLVRQPIAALFAALGIVIILRVVGWFGFVPADSPVGFLRYLEYISPATYHEGLWMAGLGGPLSSSGAYLGYALIFMALATWVLGRRDL